MRGYGKRIYSRDIKASRRSKHIASPKTANPGLRGSPSFSRTCDRLATPTGLRGRTHYRCLVPGCIFATDRVTRLENHVLRHERPNGIIEFYCDEPGACREPSQKHYRCRICPSSSRWLYLLRNHEDQHRMRRGVKESARGLFPRPTVGNILQMASGRLAKLDAIPPIFKENDMRPIRDSLGIRDAARLPELNYSDPDWRKIFRLSDFGHPNKPARRVVLLYDSRPDVWISKCDGREAARGIPTSAGVLSLPRIGSVTLSFPFICGRYSRAL